MNRWPVLALALLPALATAAETGARPRLFVLPPATTTVLTVEQLRSLDDILLSELAADPRFEVIGGLEVGRLLEVERDRQQLGCDTESDSCLAEIGGALGADWMVSSSLGRIGEQFVLNLKMYYVPRARIERRHTDTFPASEDKLIEAIRRGVRQVLPPSVNMVGPALLAGGSALSLVGGVVLGLLAVEAARQRNAALNNPVTYAAEQARAEQFAVGSNVLVGLTLTFAATAVITYFTTPAPVIHRGP